MTNVVISIYSRNGSPDAVAEGARAAGGDVRLRCAHDIVGLAVIAHVPG